MEKITIHQGLAVPLRRANVDTDAIIPKQFLKSIKKSGFGPYLFDGWRYRDTGQPGQDCAGRPINEDFVLNQPRYRGASILVADENFGCGSSREHAPWALTDYGFRIVIAKSFADIFYSNCFKNALLPIVLLPSQIEHIFDWIERTMGASITVDLLKQKVVVGDTAYDFTVDAHKKHCLINGLDDIGLTLAKSHKIKAFEDKHFARMPWLAR